MNLAQSAIVDSVAVLQVSVASHSKRATVHLVAR